MATYRVLYWQEIPAQIKTEDDRNEVNLPLDPRFQEQIDLLAMQRDLAGSEDYLEAWHWSEPLQRPGTAQEVAEAVQRELEAAFEPLTDTEEMA